MDSVGEGHVSPVPREARPFQGQRAGLVTRTAAAVIDCLVVAGALVVGSLCLSALLYVADPRQFDFPDMSRLLGASVTLAAAVAYLAIGWSLSGRTYGCHLMGLRVVDASGRHPRPLIALARSVFYVAFPIGLAVCALSKTRRSLQDMLVRTCVIYDWKSVHSPPPEV